MAAAAGRIVNDVTSLEDTRQSIAKQQARVADLHLLVSRERRGLPDWQRQTRLCLLLILGWPGVARPGLIAHCQEVANLGRKQRTKLIPGLEGGRKRKCNAP
jgi:hypothetical protein